jgi:LacI family transcriptional regulator
MVTIKDVARAAGVSVATVSRVYNDSALVRDDTRERVKRVTQELGYSPHGAARSLITSRTHTPACCLTYGEFFSEVIRGWTLPRSEGYHPVSSDTAGRRDRPLPLDARAVDGLIIMSPDLTPGLAPSLPDRFWCCSTARRAMRLDSLGTNYGAPT